MSQFVGKSQDYLQGYHAAMLDVAEFSLNETEAQQAIHEATPPSGFFGRPKAEHYLSLGAGRCSKKIGDYVFVKANEAFQARLRSRG